MPIFVSLKIFFMKKYLLFLFVVSFALSINIAKAQVPIVSDSADDFEVWADDPLGAGVKDPNTGNAGIPGWQCLNSLASPIFGTPTSPVSVFQDSTIVHKAKYACKIVSVVLNSTGYSYVKSFAPHDTVGVVFLGAVTSGNPPIILGVAFPHRVTSFSFWYQYIPATKSGIPDTASCNVVLTHYHHQIGQGSVLINAMGTWAKQVVNITYDSATTPDTLNILFSSSSLYKPLPGSILYIDDAGTPLNPQGINEVQAPSAAVDVYPNPASNKVNIRISGENAYGVEVFDITGKKINTYSVKNSAAAINTETYCPGLYIYQLYDKDGTLIKVGKFSVVQ